MTEQATFILASLVDGELHGYAIAREAQELSQGRIRLTAGTLYGALSRLRNDGLVEETREETVDGRRRRYYRLTALGQSKLSEEAVRLNDLASVIGDRVSGAGRRRATGVA